VEDILLINNVAIVSGCEFETAALPRLIKREF
jgi:hypothetical protein